MALSLSGVSFDSMGSLVSLTTVSDLEEEPRKKENKGLDTNGGIPGGSHKVGVGVVQHAVRRIDLRTDVDPALRKMPSTGLRAEDGGGHLQLTKTRANTLCCDPHKVGI